MTWPFAFEVGLIEVVLEKETLLTALILLNFTESIDSGG